MAQTTIRYKCGHEGMEQLYGPGKRRTSYAEWAADNKACPDCYRAERAAAGPEIYARRVQAGVEIYILNSYEQRELLKARGYRFGEYTSPDAPLGIRFGACGRIYSAVRKGWGIILDTEPRITREIEWLGQQGWGKIGVIDLVTELMQALGEGRPDLLPETATS